MDVLESIAIYREDDDEHMGYAVRDAIGWRAQTIFGVVISRVESHEDAERLVLEKGLSYMSGVWQYYDRDDKAWLPCIIQEANPTRVIVVRTNAMGYQEPDNFKRVTIQHPTEETLTKLS